MREEQVVERCERRKARLPDPVGAADSSFAHRAVAVFHRAQSPHDMKYRVLTLGGALLALLCLSVLPRRSDSFVLPIVLFKHFPLYHGHHHKG